MMFGRPMISELLFLKVVDIIPILITLMTMMLFTLPQELALAFAVGLIVSNTN
jgi:hypothetical protein